MDPIEQGTPATDPTSHPAPAANAAASDNTAPSQSAAREAFDRLARGEKPEDVNRDLYSKPAAGSTGKGPDKAAPRTPAARPAKEGDGQQPAAKTPAAPQQEHQGLTEDDLKVLKRGKFDLDVLKSIPPTNRKAIVNQLRNAQAEADRQFQQAKQGRAAAAAGRQNANAQPGTQDGATHGDQEHADEPPEEDEQEAAGQIPPATQQQRQQPKAGNQPGGQQAPAALDLFAGIDPSQFIDPKDLETLRALGGDDLANVQTRSMQRVMHHVQQATGPLQHAMQFLLSEMENREFSAAVDDLKRQPGFDQLGDKETTALKDKADLLIRAAGDPSKYRYSDAVKDAAASLFRTNPQAAAQAALLQRRTASIQGSVERGTSRLGENRPMTSKERDRAIYEQLQNGLGPDEARRAVDGR